MPTPYFKLKVKKNNKKQYIKRVIKFLAVNKDQATTKQIIKSTPEKVIKVICNAALNAQQGDISLTSGQKKQFGKNRKLFNILISKTIPISKKRKSLTQQGGSAILSILLSTVLSALPLLFKR